MERIQEQLLNWISGSAGPDPVTWLQQKNTELRQGRDLQKLQLNFSQVPRMIQDLPMNLSEEEIEQAQRLIPDWHPQLLDTQQAARIYLLLAFGGTGGKAFSSTVETLLSGSDMKEQLAIYAGLPVYPFPEELLPIVYEGTRSNITAVFDSITLDNPFPRDYFAKEAFDRLVLKAAFMERPFMRIIGIPQRANPELAGLLLDLISERWAAGRSVNPLLWKLVVPVLDQDRYAEFRLKAQNQDALAQSALALSFRESMSSPREFEAEHKHNWAHIEKEWEAREPFK